MAIWLMTPRIHTYKHTEKYCKNLFTAYSIIKLNLSRQLNIDSRGKVQNRMQTSHFVHLSKCFKQASWGLIWFRIRRIPHHIINFRSLIFTFHSYLTLLCCVEGRQFWLAAAVCATGCWCWVYLCWPHCHTTMTETQERGEGGGSHHSPYREQETLP